MLHSFMLSGIRKIVTTFLIFNLIFTAIGQMNDVLPSDTAADNSASATTGDNVSADTWTIDKADTVFTKEENVSTRSEIKKTDYYNDDREYKQPSIQNRGVATSPNYSGMNAQRKFLPSPVDTSSVAVPLGPVFDTTQNKQYRMGRTEKRILLVTGAVLVTGGLALILAKSFGKDDKKSEDGAGFPEPPRPPEY